MFDRLVGSEHCVVASGSSSGRELCSLRSRRLSPFTSHTRPPSLAVAGGCPARSSLGPTPTLTHTHSPSVSSLGSTPTRCTHTHSPVVALIPDPHIVVASPTPQSSHFHLPPSYALAHPPFSRARFTAPPTPTISRFYFSLSPLPTGGPHTGMILRGGSTAQIDSSKSLPPTLPDSGRVKL